MVCGTERRRGHGFPIVEDTVRQLATSTGWIREVRARHHRCDRAGHRRGCSGGLRGRERNGRDRRVTCTRGCDHYWLTGGNRFAENVGADGRGIDGAAEFTPPAFVDGARINAVLIFDFFDPAGVDPEIRQVRRVRRRRFVDAVVRFVSVPMSIRRRVGLLHLGIITFQVRVLPCS